MNRSGNTGICPSSVNAGGGLVRVEIERSGIEVHGESEE